MPPPPCSLPDFLPLVPPGALKLLLTALCPQGFRSLWVSEAGAVNVLCDGEATQTPSPDGGRWATLFHWVQMLIPGQAGAGT